MRFLTDKHEITRCWVVYLPACCTVHLKIPNYLRIFIVFILSVLSLMLLGNLPVERAKDTVCFLQRGGVSLASSAIIYNIVKVKVTRWPIDPFDPLTCRPVDLLEKEALNRNCQVHLHTSLTCSTAKGAELDCCLPSKRRRCSVWREAGAYII